MPLPLRRWYRSSYRVSQEETDNVEDCAVSRLLPTADFRVYFHVITYGSYCGLSGFGAGFSPSVRVSRAAYSMGAPYPSVTMGWYERLILIHSTERHSCNYEV